MEILVLGLVLFLGIHLLPVFTALRGRLYGALGEKGYKLLFSAVSALGLVLVVIGFGRAPAQPQLFAPSIGARHAAPLVVAASFVLLASSHMRAHIRRALRHPMLVGTALWALVHLLANGNVRATVLFGAFLAWSLLDLLSSVRRQAVKPFAPVARQDAIAVVAGIVLALLVMTFHRQLFGVAVVPWGM